MSIKAKVVINERHSIIMDQSNLLNETFGKDNWEVVQIEDEKWSEEYLTNLRYELEEGCRNVVFISPCPFLIAEMSFYSGLFKERGEFYPMIWIMHSNSKVSVKFRDECKFVPDKQSYKLIPIC